MLYAALQIRCSQPCAWQGSCLITSGRLRNPSKRVTSAASLPPDLGVPSSWSHNVTDDARKSYTMQCWDSLQYLCDTHNLTHLSAHSFSRQKGLSAQWYRPMTVDVPFHCHIYNSYTAKGMLLQGAWELTVEVTDCSQHPLMDCLDSPWLKQWWWWSVCGVQAFLGEPGQSGCQGDVKRGCIRATATSARMIPLLESPDRIPL